MPRFLVLIALLQLAANPLLAAPQITAVNGQIQHGASLMLNGQGFGEKSAGAAPYRWDNFENGTVGQPLGSPWDLVYYGGSNPVPPRYGLKSRTGFSQKTASVNFDDTGRSDFGKSAGTAPGDIYRLYLSFYAYMDFSGALSRNYKIFRSYSGAGDDHDMLVLTMYPKTGSSWQFFSPPNVNLYNDYVSGTGEDGWHKYEFWTNLLADRTEVKFWIDGKLLIDWPSNPPDTSGRGMDELRIGHYFAHDDLVCSSSASAHYGESCYPQSDNNSFCGGPCQWSSAACEAFGGCFATVSFDDVYIDQTPARVELCSKSSYAAKQSQGDLCEIQIPASWSTTSIGVNFNQGAFSSGQTAYLYVTDADGAVNPQGYPLIIAGQGQDYTAPAQPQNLRAD